MSEIVMWGFSCCLLACSAFWCLLAAKETLRSYRRFGGESDLSTAAFWIVCFGIMDMVAIYALAKALAALARYIG